MSKHTEKMSEINVEWLHDPSQVYPFLVRDRLYSAYAIGALESGQWPYCTALFAGDGEEEAALFLLSQPPEAATTIFLMGAANSLETVLRHPMSSAVFAWITAREEHLEVIRSCWRVESAEQMLRMKVGRAEFRFPEGPFSAGLRRLEPSDSLTLAEAYEVAFGSPSASRLLDRGIYYGIWKRGRLVSVAGTHMISPRYGLAAVGNVWTAPLYRGQGLATQTVAAVTRELLEDCEEVVLNVLEENIAARRVYERLGFSTYCHFWQIRGRWKG